MERSVNIFYSYSEQDQSIQFDLETHLFVLKRQGLITDWHKRKILPGEDWRGEIDRHLKSAQIILLLVSSDFLASDYCYDLEVKHALSMHEVGAACVIPIIVRPADWENTPLGKLQALPSDGKPITSRRDRYGRDKAFLDIVIGIRKVIEQRWPWPKQPKVMNPKIGHVDHDPTDFGTPGIPTSTMIYIDKSIALIQTNQADTLYDLGRYQEALELYEKAIQNDSSYAFAYCGKGETLCALKRYMEALPTYEMAIQFGGFDAYAGLGKLLSLLDRHEEALASYRRALEFDPENYEAQIGEGEMLERLGKHEEAEHAYEKARNMR